MSFKRDRKYFEAVSVMMGYIIGVGMFSMPYLISKAGVLVFLFYIIFLGSVQYFIHMLYSNIIFVTKQFHRLPGYVGLYLGERAKNTIFIAKLIGGYGALLAYIIISGIFLNQLLSPLLGANEFLYSTLFFLVGSLIVLLGVSMIAKAELFMSGMLLVIVFLIAWKGRSVMSLDNYSLIGWSNILLPYGAMIYAFDGNGSLPLIVRILGKDHEKIKSVVRVATLLSIFVIVFFTLTIIGISGAGTTADALTGVGQILDGGVILFALIFGVISMITSYIGVAESIKETYVWDYKVNKNLAWFLVVFIPYALYVLGFQSLIRVISFSGGVAGGVSVIMLVFVFMHLKKKNTKQKVLKKDYLALLGCKPYNALLYFVMALIALGVMYETYFFLVQ